MDLADLHIFRSVVHAGGVTRAAEKLNRVQSNVTTRVRQLETEGVEARWAQPAGGLYLWLQLEEGTDADALLELALEHDVSFIPGSVFSRSGRNRSALRLSYGSCETDAIPAGVARLRAALDALGT